MASLLGQGKHAGIWLLHRQGLQQRFTWHQAISRSTIDPDILVIQSFSWHFFSIEKWESRLLQMGLLGRKQGIERPSCLLSEAGRHQSFVTCWSKILRVGRFQRLLSALFYKWCRQWIWSVWNTFSATRSISEQLASQIYDKSVMQTTQGAPGALLECYKNLPSQSSGTLDCLTEASKSSTKCLKKRVQEGPGFLTTNQPPDLAALSRNSPTAHYFCTRLHVSSL